MTKNRWQSLDLERPVPRPPRSAAALERPAGPASDPDTPVEAGAVALNHARALYHLRQYPAAAAEAEAALRADPTAAEAHRLMGLALGHLGEPDRAEPHLRAALAVAPDDATVRTALQSLLIAGGREPLTPTGAEYGPGAELAGAAWWVLAQRRLRGGAPTEAAHLFEEAGRLLARSSPAPARAERILASYIGQAVSLLLAGNWAGAQAAFSHLEPAAREAPRSAAQTRRIVSFARQLYEVGEALPLLTPAEQSEALAPLRELVLGTRLEVGFNDGQYSAALHWRSLY